MPEREKPLTVKIIYEWGSVFYVKHDELQCKRILTGIKVTENGLLYCLMCNEQEGEFYACEISETEDPTFQTVKKESDSD
jgi:hypothetical protein